MDVDGLRWFQQVVDGSTVTDVAALEMVSQPGVSRALVRLEQEVGSTLLVRSGRRLRPTYAGTVFKRHVDAALHSLDDGLAAVEQLVDPETGTVAVAFQPSLGTWLVPDLISGFRREHPGVRFTLHHSDDLSGSALLAEGRIDLEFTGRRPAGPDVHHEHLFTQPLVLAVPPGHRLAGRPAASLGEVSGDDFVVFDPAWELRTLTDRLCHAAGFTPRIGFESADLAVVRALVAAGLGIAVLPRGGPGADPGSPGSEDVLVLTDPGAARDVGLCWSTRHRLLPSAELFRRHVVHQHD